MYSLLLSNCVGMYVEKREKMAESLSYPSLISFVLDLLLFVSPNLVGTSNLLPFVVNALTTSYSQDQKICSNKFLQRYQLVLVFGV